MRLFNKVSRGSKTGDFFAAARPGLTFQAGFSLVELLVAMAVVTIVAGAALVVFRATAESEARQQENLEQMQNLRAGFAAVSSDARMAGNGFRMMGTQLIQVYVDKKAFDADTSDTQDAEGWFRYKGETEYGAAALFGTNSGVVTDKADTLTIFHSSTEAFNSIGQLEEDYEPGVDNVIVLLNDITKGEEISDGDIIAVSNGTVSMITEVKLSSSTTNRLQVTGRFAPKEKMVSPSGHVFPPGTSVFNLKDVTFVTYYLDTATRRLMANYHDTAEVNGAQLGNVAAIANNIEDFQINYYILPSSSPAPVADPDPPTLSALVDGTNRITGLRLGMVSRSNSKNAEGLDSGKPVDLLDHTASSSPGSYESGFARRVLIENVRIRAITIND